MGKISKIQINKQSGIYVLKCEQIINKDLNTVWDFFATPLNLQRLTPSDLDFNITSDVAEKMYIGQIISYNISIFPLFRTNWITEITFIKPYSYFIDEQRFGPYAMWHHEHHFREIEHNKVLMTDIVSYKLPMGIVGNVIAGQVIHNKIQKIFEYRKNVVDDLFL